jgi:NAD(P)H-dependent FMN reductase
MKILAFAGSTSSTSINKQLVEFTRNLFTEHEYEVADLNDYEVPIYSSDREKASGVPERIHAFAAKIDAADLLIISLAEHNGAYSAAFKNHFDWLSRIQDRKAWGIKTSL